MNDCNLPTIQLGDILTQEQLDKCKELKTAKEICSEVIEPNKDEIERKAGNPISCKYIAYCVEFAINQVGAK